MYNIATYYSTCTFDTLVTVYRSINWLWVFRLGALFNVSLQVQVYKETELVIITFSRDKEVVEAKIGRILA